MPRIPRKKFKREWQSLFDDEATAKKRKDALQLVRNIVNDLASPEGLDMMDDKEYTGSAVFTRIIADILEEAHTRDWDLPVGILTRGWLHFLARNKRHVPQPSEETHNEYYRLYEAMDDMYHRHTKTLAEQRGVKNP